MSVCGTGGWAGAVAAGLHCCRSLPHPRLPAACTVAAATPPPLCRAPRGTLRPAPPPLQALVYAARRPDPVPHVFGYHEIFHVFVTVAALLHFVAVYRVVNGPLGAPPKAAP